MSEQRIEAFRNMLVKNPNNPLARFGLANELLKLGRHEEAVVELRAYLERHEDEGNAFGRLGEALIALGRTDEAREALTKGIEASRRFGHPSMANEFEARLEELEDA
jgi:predicted Zn-dependent protease